MADSRTERLYLLLRVSNSCCCMYTYQGNKYHLRIVTKTSSEKKIVATTSDRRNTVRFCVNCVNLIPDYIEE